MLQDEFKLSADRDYSLNLFISAMVDMISRGSSRTGSEAI
jgi:hypothetical protein